jgi:hypothetical protein
MHSGFVWMSFRASILCAARNLGEPRDVLLACPEQASEVSASNGRCLRHNNRAFGSLPYHTDLQTLDGQAAMESEQ